MSERKCSHADTRNYVNTVKGRVIVTTCRVCGKWIGQRPKEQAK